MGDANDVVTTILADAGVGTSPEKVRAVLDTAAALVPQDEGTAQLLALFTMVRSTGVIDGAIPQDSDQLDALLLRGAELFLQLRSDDLKPLFITGDPTGAVEVPVVVDHEPEL